MRVLFVHQNFPGQYVHLASMLARQRKHQVMGLMLKQPNRPLPHLRGLHVVGYRPQRSSHQDIHPWAIDLEAKLIRAEAAAEALDRVLAKGFRPDLICAHAGWGECLFFKDLVPDIPLLTYQEFFYRSKGFDLDFDLELQPNLDWRRRAGNRSKTINPLLNLIASDWSVTPTYFQHSSFPAVWQPRISVIHDGIDLAAIQQVASSRELILSDGTVVRAGEPTITFVNRRLEPYRGCHTFLRAIPAIQERHPEARILIVGGLKGVSYGARCPDGEWKDVFLREIEGRYNPARVHFTGPIPHEQFLVMLRLSAVHVYLTYPFVLSWSLLEALASGCAVVGSATQPVQEVIRDGHNGLLVDFFSPGDLAAAVCDLLERPQQRAALGEAAILSANRYGLERCLPQQLALMEMVANGVLRAVN